MKLTQREIELAILDIVDDYNNMQAQQLLSGIGIDVPIEFIEHVRGRSEEFPNEGEE